MAGKKKPKAGAPMTPLERHLAKRAAQEAAAKAKAHG